MVIEIRQFVNERGSFPDVLCKRSDLKNFSKFTNKQQKQSPGGVLSKVVLINFAKMQINIFARVSF